MVDEINDVRIIGVLTLCALLGIAMLGMEWEAKAQVGLLVILIIALINFTIGSFIPPTKADQAKGFVGYKGEVFKDNMGPDFREGESFFSVFSVFFPAATGILAGANISGDLADAQKAIPKGTLLAILITTITYIFMGWIAGACVLRDAPGLAAEFLLNNNTQLYNITSTMATYTYSALEAAKELVVERASNATVCENPGDCAFGLHNDMQVMQLISGFGPITIAGIISATLSSALASLVSAPKVFQAVCKDKIFPGIHVFAKGYGKAEEPRLAYLLTFVIAIGCICIGSLNAIAPLISNFFLMSYALINYSCFDASLAKSPGWRPAFQFYSMWIALIGALLCLGVMFVINWWTALITFVLVAFFYIYTLYRKPDINWGSSTQAHVYRNALQHTMKLVSVMEHVKNFRPQVLCLSGFPSDRTPLVDFGSSISKNISLMICGHIIIGEPSEHLNDMRKMSRLGYLWLHKRKVKSFYTAVIAKNLREGTQSLLQAAGLGKLRPNMVLMGFKSDWQTADPRDVDNYFHIVHDTFDLHYGVGILRLKDGICTDQSTSEAVHVVEEAVSEENINEGSPLKANRESHDSLDLLDVNQDASGWESNCELSENEMDGEEELGKGKKEQKEEKKRRFKINKEVLKSVNYFSRKQKKGTIDVYWLFDDGGLTLLIPYILTMKRQWSGCHLRVYIAGTKKGELDRDQRHMATLLSKFRIEYSSMTVIPDLGKRPHQDRVKQFEELTKDWIMDEEKGETKESHPWKIPANDYQSLKDKTYRHIRCRELLEQYSMESTLVVMTLPMPRKGLCPSSLYMAWIEYLTKDLPPPILLVRGNQDNVLTFYS